MRGATSLISTDPAVDTIRAWQPRLLTKRDIGDMPGIDQASGLRGAVALPIPASPELCYGCFSLASGRNSIAAMARGLSSELQQSPARVIGYCKVSCVALQGRQARFPDVTADLSRQAWDSLYAAPCNGGKVKQELAAVRRYGEHICLAKHRLCDGRGCIVLHQGHAPILTAGQLGEEVQSNGDDG